MHIHQMFYGQNYAMTKTFIETNKNSYSGIIIQTEIQVIFLLGDKDYGYLT